MAIACDRHMEALGELKGADRHVVVTAMGAVQHEFDLCSDCTFTLNVWLQSGGVEFVRKVDNALRAKLLESFDEWSNARERVSGLEAEGKAPADDWHASDDAAVELLQEFAAWAGEAR